MVRWCVRHGWVSVWGEGANLWGCAPVRPRTGGDASATNVTTANAPFGLKQGSNGSTHLGHPLDRVERLGSGKGEARLRLFFVPAKNWNFFDYNAPIRRHPSAAC
jgi:hypothetical protein